MTIKSTSYCQHEIIAAIRTLHCPEGFDCDMTFGNGAFWKDSNNPTYCFDIDPQVDGVVKADSQMLPLNSGEIGSCVFDPPFLTYVKAGRTHKNGKVAMTARFGGYWAYSELEEHYIGSISEAYRILRKGGVLTVKCQDIIHNHKMHCTHANVIGWAENEGFRLLDLFVLNAKHRMPSPQKGTQRHARIFHSYFLVFKK
jgi:hypothetical protein